MNQVVFEFDNNEASEAFFQWWVSKGQEIWKRDADEDDYIYDIDNYYTDLKIKINEYIK